MGFVVCVRLFGEMKSTTEVLCEMWRENFFTKYRDNIRTYFRAIGRWMWTGFIWLIIQTVRGHHCTSQSDAVSLWYWNSCTESFTEFEQCSCSLLQTVLYCCFCVTKCLESGRDWPAVFCYQFGDHIDLKSSGEYPRINTHTHCDCAACSVTPCSTAQLGMS